MDATAHSKCAVELRVARCEPLCREHTLLELVGHDFPRSAPGQFLQVRCGADEDDAPRELRWNDGEFPQVVGQTWNPDHTLLRRPFSIADRYEDADGQTHIVLISRAIGRGTRWLESLAVKDRLSVTGPLGNTFTIPNAPRPLALVGGGVGIPPMLYLARALHAAGQIDATAIFGSLTADLMPVHTLQTPSADGAPSLCAQLPGDAPFPTILTTDDGSLGLRGRVTDGLQVWHARLAAGSPRPLVYACGPEPMLRAVANLTRQLGCDAELCIEKMMGCGLGTCLSCVVQVVDPDSPRGWRWALSCSEGPVFPRDTLVEMA